MRPQYEQKEYKKRGYQLSAYLNYAIIEGEKIESVCQIQNETCLNVVEKENNYRRIVLRKPYNYSLLFLD